MLQMAITPATPIVVGVPRRPGHVEDLRGLVCCDVSAQA